MILKSWMICSLALLIFGGFIGTSNAQTDVPKDYLKPLATGLPPIPDPITYKKPWTSKLGAHDGLLFKDDSPFVAIGMVANLSDQQLGEMAAMGCNAIHFEVGWNATTLATGGKIPPHNLTLIHGGIKNAGSWGLAAFPLMSGHYVPDWFRDAHPLKDGWPVGSDGLPTGEWFPYSTHYRPYQDALASFWTSLAPEFASEPNVMTINMWNEPCYGGTYVNPNQYADYSDAGISDYHLYLRSKYHGSLSELSAALGHPYSSFDLVDPPLNPDQYGRKAWLEWMEYGQLALAGFFKDERKIIRDVAPNAILANKKETQPWDVNAAASGVNWNLLSRSEDVSGINVYTGSPNLRRDFVEAARSESGGRPVVVYETNTMPSGVNNRTPDLIRIQLWSTMLGGANGMFIFALIKEGEHAFLTDSATSMVARQEYVSIFKTIARLQRQLGSVPIKARVAVLHSTTSVVEYPGRTIPNAVLGAYELVRDNGYSADFLPQEFFTDQVLSRYQVLVIPSYGILKPGERQVLDRWVAKGGKVLLFQNSLITDAYLKPIPKPSWMPVAKVAATPKIVKSGSGNVAVITSLSIQNDITFSLAEQVLGNVFHMAPDAALMNGGHPSVGTLISLRNDYSDPHIRYLLALNTEDRALKLTPKLIGNWKFVKEWVQGVANPTAPMVLQPKQMYVYELHSN